MNIRSKVELGNHIRSQLEARNILQTDLAEKSGVPIGTIRNCVSGRTYPAADTLAEISKALNISLDSMMFSDNAFTAIVQDNSFFGCLTENQKSKISLIATRIAAHVRIIGCKPYDPVEIIDDTIRQSLNLITQAVEAHRKPITLEECNTLAKDAAAVLEDIKSEPPVLRGLDRADTPVIHEAPIEDRPHNDNTRDELPRYPLRPAPAGTAPALAWYDLACGAEMEMEPMCSIYAIAAPGMKGNQIARVRGDSMNDTLFDGDLVILQPLEVALEPLDPDADKAPLSRIVSQVPDRSIVVYSLNDAPPTCKRLRYMRGASWHILLDADNRFTPNFPHLLKRSDSLRIFARVIGLGLQD